MGDAIREQIRARFQLKDVLVRALHMAFACMESMGTKAHSAIAPPHQQPTTVEDLLPSMRCEPQWTGLASLFSEEDQRERGEADRHGSDDGW